jgi:Coiled-coil domain containing protein (DUF2052)
MNRLISEGDYFSEGAMRARAPLLHYQYVGQYRPAPDVSVGANLSDSILANYDEAQTLELLSHERRREEEQEEEEGVWGDI